MHKSFLRLHLLEVNAFPQFLLGPLEIQMFWTPPLRNRKKQIMHEPFLKLSKPYCFQRNPFSTAYGYYFLENLQNYDPTLKKKRIIGPHLLFGGTLITMIIISP